MPALIIFLSTRTPARVVLPLDAPFTLRKMDVAILESEYHRMILSESTLSYVFPRPCRSGTDSDIACADRGWRLYRDSSNTRSISAGPVLGYEHRNLADAANAFDLGVAAAGKTGPVSFDLDARTFTELHDEARHASFDREFVERQDEKASGSIAYSSYSRFRTHVAYDMDWGRLVFARDAAQWGPGLFQNLVFSQDAIPFNQIVFSTRLGPIFLTSLYGQLALDSNWETDTSSARRSIYAHRYEWQVSRNLLLGASEQLILTKVSSPFSFIPVVPLFIAKAVEKEALNNGNIDFDASWRFPGLGNVYSEFYVDDLQSPTSLFNDYWGNKWAWMAGAHWIPPWWGRTAGFIGEYSRIEPWVYTHYHKNTAQAANGGYPLGNQAGPNSQSVTLKAYARPSEAWYLSGRLDLRWKGKDPGSSLNDEISNSPPPKQFLGGVIDREILITPFICYRREWVALSLNSTWGSRKEVVARMQIEF